MGILRSIFYAIYVTDVVGLDARLGSLAALIGLIWDGMNDPLIGMLSDRIRTRWGRRLPFLLWFGVPFGVSFVFLWWAPPWKSQIALALHITLVFILADTLSTLIAIPYLSLTPELVEDYDERTLLTGFRTFFQLAAGLTVVVTAPMIVDSMLAAGFTQQQGFLLAGSLFGLLAIPPYLIMPFVLKERPPDQTSPAISLSEMLRTAWANKPFRVVAAIHTLNWSAADMMAVMFPYFALYWLAAGDPLTTVHIAGIDLALESACLGIVLLLTIAAVPFWLWLSRRTNKRLAYMSGILFWVIVQIMVFTVQPGQIEKMLWLCALLGIGLSAGYVLPDSMLPDIIEWDELHTHRRQEGVYYGARAFIRKMSGALAVAAALQLLGWSGYTAPSAGVSVYQQPETALRMIRLLISPISAAFLLGAALFAWMYPLSREKHGRLRRLLERRRRITI